MGVRTDIGGMYDWEAVAPDPPVSITVPATDSDGNYIVSWSSSSGASSYQLEEADNPLFSGAVEVYDGSDLSFDVTGKPEGTYYYRVKATNEAGSSGWAEGANGCRVAPPGIRITPDLGWADLEAMFDPELNAKAALFRMSSLVETSDPDLYRKSRDTLVFQVGGARYRLPAGSMSKLGGSTKHYWRYEAETYGDIQAFILSRSQQGLSSPSAAASSTQLPSILR